MKCNGCRFKCYHAPGGFQSVAEGGDDPYKYEFCALGHWEDAPGELAKLEIDIWINCQDFKPKEEK